MKSSQSSGKPYRNLAGKIWPVDFNSFEEEWDCESSHHHIEITYPLADRRVVELLLQIPVEHFYAKGLKRGLIRLAMDGILPEKNRLRNNKGDYSPGHSEIIQRELGKIVSSLDMKKTSRLGEFIDIEKLKIMLEDISKLQNNDNFAFKPMQLVLFANRILFEKWNNSIN
jgi:asparagine synthase (glutamine-hydrolysing)